MVFCNEISICFITTHRRPRPPGAPVAARRGARNHGADSLRAAAAAGGPRNGGGRLRKAEVGQGM